MLSGLLEQCANVCQRMANMIADGTLTVEDLLNSLGLVSATVDYVLEVIGSSNE